jgi:hypothetical protein
MAWTIMLPLPELVAKRQDPLLRSRPLLVAPGATERGIEAVRGDRIQQGHGLQRVARGPRATLIDDPASGAEQPDNDARW